LNARQKKVVLALVKAFASKQKKGWHQLYKEQKQVIKNNTVRQKIIGEALIPK
jgi:hypothetical protein